MKAWILESPAPIEIHPLKQVELPNPQVQPGQVRIRTKVCGVCLTDLHVCEGDLPFKHPVSPSHQVIGCIDHAVMKI